MSVEEEVATRQRASTLASVRYASVEGLYGCQCGSSFSLPNFFYCQRCCLLRCRSVIQQNYFKNRSNWEINFMQILCDRINSVLLLPIMFTKCGIGRSIRNRQPVKKFKKFAQI